MWNLYKNVPLDSHICSICQYVIPQSVNGEIRWDLDIQVKATSIKLPLVFTWTSAWDVTFLLVARDTGD